MKRIAILLLCLISLTPAFSQEIAGDWHGVLSTPKGDLTIALHFKPDGPSYTGTMDVIEQNAKGLNIDKIDLHRSDLTFTVSFAGIQYKGTVETEDYISGEFSQGVAKLPLNFERGVVDIDAPNRPQEPKGPYTYKREEVSFKGGADDVELAGTLTIPLDKKRYPLAVLITGSGPQDRNEELLGHKPFLVIADYLTKKGVAVLRYDDRGVAKSIGDFTAATSKDFANDVAAAVAYLQTRKDLSISKIGLIGHSEGGMIAPMVAADNDQVDFIVSLAGIGVSGQKLLLTQQEDISRNQGVSEEEIAKMLRVNKEMMRIIKQSKDANEADSLLVIYLDEIIDKGEDITLQPGQNKQKLIRSQIAAYNTPWMRYFIAYDPQPILKQVSCPTLALNGENDLQVASKENLKQIKAALKKGGNKQVKTKSFKNLNHLFQTSETGDISEYSKIEETFSPTVLEYMTKWILNLE
jgi:pimeloyl-ACP methyl ester carboxylesterase